MRQPARGDELLHGHAVLAQQVDDPPQAERRAFQQGAIQMRRLMLQRQSRERAAELPSISGVRQPLNQSRQRTPSAAGGTRARSVRAGRSSLARRSRRSQSNASPTAACPVS